MLVLTIVVFLLVVLGGVVFLLRKQILWTQGLARAFLKRTLIGIQVPTQFGAWIMFVFLAPRSGPIEFFPLAVWAVLNLTALYALYFFPPSPDFLIASAGFAFFHILIVGARLMMTREEMRVTEGLAIASKARFRRFANALPPAVVGTSAVALALAIPPLLANINWQWPGQVFRAPVTSTMNDWALFFIGDILRARVAIEAIPTILPWSVPKQVIETNGTLGQVVYYIAYGLIAIFLYQAAVSHIRMSALRRTLLDAILDPSELNFRVIKAKLAWMPPYMKRDVMTLAFDHPDEEVRGRATDLVARMGIYSFVRIRLIKLHLEASENVKRHALVQILKILRHPETSISRIEAQKILNAVNHQIYKRRKKHSQELQNMLVEIRMIVQPLAQR